MTTDETRTGLVHLEALAGYRLVNLAGRRGEHALGAADDAALAELAGDQEGLVLAALCERPHVTGNDDEDGADPGPYLLTVAAGTGTTANLAELAWAAAVHEAEHHDGAGPVRQYETGADLERLYANTRTLWHGVDQLAGAMRIGWDVDSAAGVLRAAEHRLGQYADVVRACRAGLSQTPPTTDWHRAMDALNGLGGVLTPAAPIEAPGLRCTAVCPREQAGPIASAAGVRRVDVDWRCYLAPHSGVRHSVLPDPDGRAHPFLAPEEVR